MEMPLLCGASYVSVNGVSGKSRSRGVTSFQTNPRFRRKALWKVLVLVYWYANVLGRMSGFASCRNILLSFCCAFHALKVVNARVGSLYR